VAFVTGVFLTLLLGTGYLGGWLRERRAQRKIERSLQKAERGRQQFIRRLDHEMKNPLTGLRTAIVNLQEIQDPEDRQRAAENARRAMERLTRLLADLRNLSDLEAHSIERLQVDIPELLGEVVEAACSLPAYQERNVNLFVTRVPSPLPRVT